MVCFRDLVEIAVHRTRAAMKERKAESVKEEVETRLLDALVGKSSQATDDVVRRRQEFLEHLRAGQLEDTRVTVDVPVKRQAGEGHEFEQQMQLIIQTYFGGEPGVVQGGWHSQA